MTYQHLDVRELPKPQKHPAIFATYTELPVGGSFVLLNNHDPKHLRNEFDTDYPGGYEWTYLESGPEVWRIEIGKRASTALPQIVVNTMDAAATTEADLAGVVWKLPVAARDLDSNVIALPAGGHIGAHRGPDVDVLLQVLGGSGTLTTELDIDVALKPGDVVWLPRGSRRQFFSGPEGLRYLTVHKRRKALVLQSPEPRPGS